MRINRTEEFVTGGYTKGGRMFDAIIVGRYEGERLVYVARTSRVHTGGYRGPGADPNKRPATATTSNA